MHFLDGTYRPGMASAEIEQALSAAETALERGETLRGTGFWPAVAKVKTEPELATRYGDRIASIDQSAFSAWALLTVPIAPGTVLAVFGLAVGLLLIGYAYYLTGLTAVIVFYLGFGALLVTTHGLAHLLVGRLGGIRFTAWFVGSMSRPQPGVKTDYASYLRTPARRRAWMHASGAIVTKLVPFALIGAAIAAGLPAWAVVILPVVGVVSIITDVLWSTQGSDWHKFSREMRLAQTD